MDFVDTSHTDRKREPIVGTFELHVRAIGCSNSAYIASHNNFCGPLAGPTEQCNWNLRIHRVQHGNIRIAQEFYAQNVLSAHVIMAFQLLEIGNLVNCLDQVFPRFFGPESDLHQLLRCHDIAAPANHVHQKFPEVELRGISVVEFAHAHRIQIAIHENIMRCHVGFLGSRKPKLINI